MSSSDQTIDNDILQFDSDTDSNIDTDTDRHAISIIPDTNSKKENAQNINIDIEEKISNAKKVILTYGQNCCYHAKKRLCDSAFLFGGINAETDECFMYDANVMDQEFRSENANILNKGRGAGYWLWKPYIILKHLTDDELPDGSYIMYTDAGAKFIGDIRHVLRLLEEQNDKFKGVLFFGVGYEQKRYCKRDAFILQNCDSNACHNAMQINAFFSVFRKCDYSRMVVEQWLKDCTDSRILTDDANVMGKPNLPGFRDHRHDQAVVTNVMNSRGWYYDTTNGPILDKVMHHDRFKG